MTMQPIKSVHDAITPIPRQRTAEELHAIISQVFSNENIKLRSGLTQRQVLAVCRAWSFAEYLKVKNPQSYAADKLMDMTIYLLETQVSVKYRGRDDLRDALKAALFNNDESSNGSVVKRLLGS